MTREEYLALVRKNLEIVFYVRDGQNGNPKLVHEAVKRLPENALMDLSDSFTPAKLLIQEEYFSREDVDDLAIECERAFIISEKEIEAHDTGSAFSLN